MARLETLRAVLGDVLKLGSRAQLLTPDTQLFGAMPELDSMAVILLVVEIEERFGIMLDDDDVTAEHFETVATLLALVESKH